MRIVIQRVSHASVTIDGVCKSAILKKLIIKKMQTGYVKR